MSEKCKQCGKEDVSYMLGFCSYTCWKKCLDKTLQDNPRYSKKQLLKNFGLQEEANDDITKL